MKSRAFYTIIILFMFGCHSPNNFYQKTVSLSNNWQSDNAVSFNIPVNSSQDSYNIFMVLRNNNDYPFSNIYFFTEFTSPDGNKMIDTLEYQLAYPNGEWIGSGMGGIKENTLVYKENIALKDTGTYQLKIKQAMRENPLVGIEDIGLIVEKEK